MRVLRRRTQISASQTPGHAVDCRRSLTRIGTSARSARVNFDERQFRAALGAFPTGVAVVTARTESGERLGITVSSFNSVSLSPPLILFSLARRAHSYPAWIGASHYAVNILSEQ